ncbi:MauE/DoxX family redox-associated membrane protein [Pseudonocardia acaciae]|uniref:MauE/DoxX family redox-associated membrane protein n=1 Tax=Pseudonocardia acaciae TaxID=551276 RepID=UPI00048EBBA2|nr:MauE/DoxX family redox-associated membrane protein [Pseudonocardia acaciae]
MGYVVVSCRALLALVFLAAVVSKVRSRAAFAEFAEPLRRLRLVSGSWVRPVAVAVVVAEAAVPVVLAVPATVTAGFVLAGAVLVVFMAAITVSMRRGTAVPCPCFGSAAATPLGARHVVRNALLLAVAVAGGAGSLTGDPGAVQPAGVLICLSAAAVLALMVVRFDDLVELYSTTSTAQH